MFFASVSVIGLDGAVSEISVRSFERTLGLVTIYKNVTRIDVDDVSEPAFLVIAVSMITTVPVMTFEEALGEGSHLNNNL